ncbi:MAG: hypothetical protein K2J99_17865 [Lachnospiraceae bacterium]|nr:hypothetical protein [Lachnospiraceae bacterium]
MACRNIAISEICSKLDLNMMGNDVLINGLNLCNRRSAHQNILTYVTSSGYIDDITHNHAVVAVVLSKELVGEYECALAERQICFILNDYPEQAFYDIHDFLYYHTDFYERYNFEKVIGDNVCIAPSAVIEDGVVIGSRVCIGANTVIKRGAVIEDDCIIGCNTTIGSEGFQVLRIANENRKIVHAGGVLIREKASVGDNVCVCNSLFEDVSRIGKNVKIDNLCYIAHNVVIGDNAVITAGCMLCGSSVIEEGAWIGVNSSVLNRVEVGNGSKIGMGSVVTRNIPEHSMAYGVPAKIKEVSYTI